MVICGAPSYCDERRNLIDNPVLIVEVLSPSTQACDRGEKFEVYKQLDSLREYLLIAQDRPLVERFARTPDGWRRTGSVGLSAVVQLESPPVSIEFSEIYRRVDWESEGAKSDG